MLEFQDLPGEIMADVFRHYNQHELDGLLELFNHPFHQESEIFKIIRLVKYSRIIVTNSWHDSLVLLARAKKIVPIDQFPKYKVWSLFEFLSEVDSLPSKYYPKVNCPKKIIYAFGNDHQYQPDIYKVIRHFSKYLKRVPATIAPLSKEIHIFLSQADSLVPELQHDVHSTFFNHILMSHSNLDSLASLSLESDFHSPESKIDFAVLREFTCLQTLILRNLDLSNLPQLDFPPCLRDLTLVNNSIKSIQGWSLPQNLKKLDLSHNTLTSLDGTLLPQSLKLLKLHENKLDICHLLPNSISELDISLNNFSELEFNVPSDLKILYTDWAQYYLMPSFLRQRLMSQRVIILH